MKRVDLIRHLHEHGCLLLREGGNHSIYVNPAGNFVSAVPRHREVKDYTAKKVCADLKVPPPP